MLWIFLDHETHYNIYTHSYGYEIIINASLAKYAK